MLDTSLCHLLIPKRPLIVPGLVVPDHPALPDGLGELARLEQDMWQADAEAIVGPQMVSLIGNVGASTMLNALKEFKVRLHVGNPGAAGLNNEAAENTLKNFNMGEAAFEARKRTNSSAPEWVEVKANETWKFFSVWIGGGVNFGGYGELTVPVEAKIGDTARFPVGSIVWEVP